MKTTLFACLLVVSTTAFSTEFRIFDQHLTIRPDCVLEIKRPDGSQEKKALPLNGNGKCTIINLGHTNIPQLEFVHGAYVFLVELPEGLGGDCSAVYVGVAVPRNGRVKVLPEVRRTGTCGADRDRKEFEYLYYQGTK